MADKPKSEPKTQDNDQESKFQKVNFREAQAKNRRRTTLLIIGFVLFFALVGAVFGAAFAGGAGENASEAEKDAVLFNAMLWGVIITCGIAVVWVTIGWLAGGPMTLAVSRAKKITEPKNQQEQELFNVVEEMSVAAGLPKPSVHIIHDTAMNAFACGRNPKVAAIAVTSGALEKLNREELQGIVGHEMGHIKNHDIKFMVMLMMLIGLLVIFCDIFLRTMLYTGGRRSSDNKNSGQGIFMIIGLVLAILAPIFARIIFFAVSREREFLADATSVELNRNPQGIMSALAKLSGDKEVLEVANRGTAPMFIVHPIKKFEARASSIFSTHPPIKERVERLSAMK